MEKILQLEIELLDLNPRIWRRIAVSDRLRLSDLHRVLQTALGWEDRHRYHFEAAEVTYLPADPEEDGAPPERTCEKVRLADLHLRSGDEVEYLYDFGDGWEHRLLVERIWPRRQEDGEAELLAGERACPPEDCGGAAGYEEILGILADAKHPEHASTLEWLGGDFDARAFDLTEQREKVRKAMG